ncbi:hypothetical protein HQ520_02600 [bacterium]|nr:hypothetical protein [bacterium]
MTISTVEFLDLIKAHMDNQPYACKCADCGADLDVDATVDRECDLFIKVSPCACAKEEDQP